jgi:hypothetical protein
MDGQLSLFLKHWGLQHSCNSNKSNNNDYSDDSNIIIIVYCTGSYGTHEILLSCTG